MRKTIRTVVLVAVPLVAALGVETGRADEGITTTVYNRFSQTSTPLTNPQGTFEAVFTHRFNQAAKDAWIQFRTGMNPAQAILKQLISNKLDPVENDEGFEAYQKTAQTNPAFALEFLDNRHHHEAGQHLFPRLIAPPDDRSRIGVRAIGRRVVVPGRRNEPGPPAPCSRTGSTRRSREHDGKAPPIRLLRVAPSRAPSARRRSRSRRGAHRQGSPRHARSPTAVRAARRRIR